MLRTRERAEKDFYTASVLDVEQYRPLYSGFNSGGGGGEGSLLMVLA